MIVFYSLIFFILLFIFKKEWLKVIAFFHVFLFLLLSMIVNDYLGPLKCADGWMSPSIGSQGACSWHGGVENRSFWFFLCLVISGLSYVYCYSVYENKRQACRRN